MGRPKNNLLEQRFGKWKVIEEAGTDNNSQALWKCVCDCGNEAVVIGTMLTIGKSTSCGCSRRKDLLGQRFGKLKVNRFAGISKRSEVLWDCTCDCGNKTIVNGKALRQGRVKSCGCIRIEWASTLFKFRL